MTKQMTTDEKLWTPANIVTVLRICLVPLFVLVILSPWPDSMPESLHAELWQPWIAAFVFILLAATDGVDGYLARSRNEVTNFGKLMDPLADKILVAAALLALIELQVLPSWVALVILAREFIVSGIRMIAASQGVVIAASWYGKAKTVTQIIAIVLFIVMDSISVAAGIPPHGAFFIVSWVVMGAAVALTIISMLDYFVKAKHLFGFQPCKSVAAQMSEDSRIAAEAAELDERIESLAVGILESAREKGETVGTAESLTGGLIASALTSIAGSSDVVRGGVVSYSAEVKEDVLGVDSQTIESCGVVSEATASAMASGAAKMLECSLAVAVTGIAGPGGAEPGKPVGTVCFGYSVHGDVETETLRFDGDRDAVRKQTVEHALKRLSEFLK